MTTWCQLDRSGWYTPLASLYRETRQVGEGTYGKVFEGGSRSPPTTNSSSSSNSNSTTGGGPVVALKKVKVSSEKNPTRGLPQNALREIRLLKHKCQHPNIVKLLDVAAAVLPDSEKSSNNKDEDCLDLETTEGANSTSGFIYLVFEYVDHDLSGILASKYKFTPEVTACLTKQLLSGLAYLHEQNICHRDLKTSNLLIGRNHHLKLADFGLARELIPDDPTVTYTNKVITLWYRPPELLLGDKHYSCAVDVWSVGCILMELVRSQPLFAGQDEMDQLKRVCEIVGLPTSASWPNYNSFPNSSWINKFSLTLGASSSMAAFCESKNVEGDVAALVTRMLELDPARRCTAKQALTSRYCANALDPAALPPLDLPDGVTLHEWEAKGEKRRLRQVAAAAAAAAAGGGPPPPPPPPPPPVAVAPTAQASAPAGNTTTTPPFATLFMGNLPFNITEAEVMEFLTKHGVHGCRVKLSRRPGQWECKGFGHLYISDKNSVTTALAISARGIQTPWGRSLKIEEAVGEKASSVEMRMRQHHQEEQRPSQQLPPPHGAAGGVRPAPTTQAAQHGGIISIGTATTNEHAPKRPRAEDGEVVVPTQADPPPSMALSHLPRRPNASGIATGSNVFPRGPPPPPPQR